MTEKKRIEFIDLAKGVCILLVVIFHVIPAMNNRFEFLNCLRMPLYFCLSGLFYKSYGGFRDFMEKKAVKILIPFVAWYIIGYCIYYTGRLLFPSGNDSSFHILDVFYQNEIFNLPVWFLLCLFWSSLLFAGVCKIAKAWYYRLVALTLVSALGWLMSYLNIFNFLYLGSSMTCLPFFFLGYTLKQTSLLYPSHHKKREFIFMLGALALATAFAFIPDSIPRLNYYKNEIIGGNPFSIYLCAAFFVTGVLIACKLIGRLPFISWLGRYSIIVLVTHVIIMELTAKTLKKISPIELSELTFNLILLSVVIAGVSLMIPFCKRFLPYITAQKDFSLKLKKHPNPDNCN